MPSDCPWGSFGATSEIPPEFLCIPLGFHLERLLESLQDPLRIP